MKLKLIEQRDGLFIIRTDCPEKGAFEHNRPFCSAYTKQDAELIVKAVNRHDEVLASLREVLEHIHPFYRGDTNARNWLSTAREIAGGK